MTQSRQRLSIKRSLKNKDMPSKRVPSKHVKSPHNATRNKAPKDTKIVLFNKPFNVLCQFSGDDGRQTLADYITVKDIYAAGRLDRDSEGLLLLTNDGKLQARITQPNNKMAKTYWVQVEGIPSQEAIEKLNRGVTLKDGLTRPATVTVINEPENLWPRTPPIRERQSIPTTWLEVTITEGRNRQVRRMTAHIGHPTLRLIRYRIGQWTLDGIESSQWLQIKGK